jgi:hypothetical protein
MPVQYDIVPHEHSIKVEYDNRYVRRRLEAKDLLSGRDGFTSADDRVVSAIRGALRRAFPAVKFRVYQMWRLELYVEIRWQGDPDISSKVQTVAGHAITTLCTIPERMTRPSAASRSH